VLAIDDSPFSFDDETSLIIGVVVRPPNYLEAVMSTRMTVDGDDGTDVLSEMIMGSRYLEQVRMVMLDGIGMSGFNVIDMDLLAERTGKPCMTFTRERPDLMAMRAALRAHFDDWERRFSLVTAHPTKEVVLEGSRFWSSIVGMDEGEAISTAASCMVRGNVPEPLRMAHLIAAGVGRGESRGRP